MMKIALLVLTLGLVSFSSFANNVELNDLERTNLLKNMIEYSETPEKIRDSLDYLVNGPRDGETLHAEIMSQKCSVIGRSMLVICRIVIGEESNTEDDDSGFDSVFQLETVHMMNSMSLLRVTFTPLAG